MCTALFIRLNDYVVHRFFCTQGRTEGGKGGSNAPGAELLVAPKSPTITQVLFPMQYIVPERR